MTGWLIRRALGLAVLSALATGVQAQPAGVSSRTIKIGVLIPISGPASYFGVQDKQGYELALAQFKDVAGYSFEISYEDSQCNPLAATQAVKRMLEQSKPDIVFGEECSDASLAILPILTEAKVPMLNAGSTTARLTRQGSQWVFRIFPDDIMQGVSLANNAYYKLKARKAVLLHENTNAGIGNAAEFAKNFTSMGGEIVQRIGFDRTVNDFTSIATRIAGLGPVDVIPTFSLEGQGVKISQALEQAKVVRGGGGPAIQMGSIWLPAGFDEKAGRAAEGYIRIVQFNPQENSPVVQGFVKAFQARYGADKVPSHIHAHAYDQVLVLADAVRRGGKDTQSIRDRLAEIHGLRATTGIINFDSTGQNTSPTVMHYVETRPDLKWQALDWK